MSLNVLFLTTPEEDYLQDSLLYGLRNVLGENCVDYPRKDVMYQTCQRPAAQIYGNGFTLWKLLDDIPIDRTEIESKVRNGYFAQVVFGSVCRQTKFLKIFWADLLRRRTRFIFADGEDSSGWRKKQLLGLLWPYYKREREGFGTLFSSPIGFSIPSTRINSIEVGEKRFLFARHVQCSEAYQIPWIRKNCQRSYAFMNEEEYRENLAHSFYAVTMKKAGWDCMRHYEIAASGTVMAFYNLSDKPEGCAPHGLVDMINAVSFRSAAELLEKMQCIVDQDRYSELRDGTLAWAREHICEKVATQLLRR